MRLGEATRRQERANSQYSRCNELRSQPAHEHALPWFMADLAPQHRHEITDFPSALDQRENLVIGVARST
jgi:hypothetical protein